MNLFYVFSFLLMCSVPTEGLSKAEREKLCSKRNGCIWLNTFFNRSHGFPIRNTVDNSHYLETYCYDGPEPLTTEGLSNIWHSLHIVVKCDTSNYITILFSNTSIDIEESGDKLTYLDAANGTTFSRFTKPYNVTCVGVMYSGRDLVNYKLYAGLELMWRFPMLLTAGIFLLFSARPMSRSIMFHYGTGVTLGILTSMLILLYFFSKLVPKKNILGLGVLAGGFTLAGSFIYWMYKHSLELIVSMWQYFVVYVFIAGAVSFAVIYRFGPVENPRTINLIQWSIQLVALLFIGLASQVPEVGLIFIVLALIFYFVPARYNPVVMVLLPIYCLLSCLLAPFHKCLILLGGGRYKYRYLTLEEYDEQGRVETEKALNELREFVRKNSSDAWEIIGNLRNANRFTTFLSGKNHVTEQEQVDHEWSFVMSSTDVDEESEGDGTESLEYSGTPSRFGHSPSSCDSSTHSTSFHHSSDNSPSSQHRSYPPPSRTPAHHRRH